MMGQTPVKISFVLKTLSKQDLVRIFANRHKRFQVQYYNSRGVGSKVTVGYIQVAGIFRLEQRQRRLLDCALTLSDDSCK